MRTLQIAKRVANITTKQRRPSDATGVDIKRIVEVDGETYIVPVNEDLRVLYAGDEAGGFVIHGDSGTVTRLDAATCKHGSGYATKCVRETGMKTK